MSHEQRVLSGPAIDYLVWAPLVGCTGTSLGGRLGRGFGALGVWCPTTKTCSPSVWDSNRSWGRPFHDDSPRSYSASVTQLWNDGSRVATCRWCSLKQDVKRCRLRRCSISTKPSAPARPMGPFAIHLLLR